MDIHHIPITRQARYYTLGELNAKTTQIYIVLHGYGQLASQIIRKFDKMPSDVFIIAPEGLSRFYWDGTKGHVGASWMTKEDRNYEIEEYCNFLQAVFDHFILSMPNNALVNVLGFSQGGATAMRWLLLKQPSKINNIILWGSDTPPELDYKNTQSYLSDKELFWVYGNKDEYLPNQRIEQLEKRFVQFQLSPKTIVFEGGHELHRPTLVDLHQHFSKKQ